MSTYNQKYYEPLKLMTPIRHKYIKNNILKLKKTDYRSYFKKKLILDIGTGTGEYLEVFKDFGSQCVGIDEINNFKVKNSKNFKLIKTDLFNYLKSSQNNKFDIIFCFEVIEHINDKDKFFKLVKKNLKKGGLFFMSTINRNYLSKILLIDFAENLLKLLPKNTHNPKLFITTEEVIQYSKKYDLKVRDISGIRFNPFFKNFSFTKNQLINFITLIEN